MHVAVFWRDPAWCPAWCSVALCTVQTALCELRNEQVVGRTGQCGVSLANNALPKWKLPALALASIAVWPVLAEHQSHHLRTAMGCVASDC